MGIAVCVLEVIKMHECLSVEHLSSNSGTRGACVSAMTWVCASSNLWLEVFWGIFWPTPDVSARKKNKKPRKIDKRKIISCKMGWQGASVCSFAEKKKFYLLAVQSCRVMLSSCSEYPRPESTKLCSFPFLDHWKASSVTSQQVVSN